MWDKSPVLFADVVEKDAVKHVKTIGRDIISSLVDQSPLDEFQYVSNHNVSIGQPDWTHIESKKLGSRGSETQGLATINSVVKLDDLWFTNATPYGEELEDGKSGQAPTGVYLPVFLFTAQMYKG